MKKATKNRKLSLEKIDLDKFYSLDEASELVKEITTQNLIHQLIWQ